MSTTGSRKHRLEDYETPEYLKDAAAFETERVRKELARTKPARSGPARRGAARIERSNSGVDADEPTVRSPLRLSVGEAELTFMQIPPGRIVLGVPPAVREAILSLPNRNRDINRFAEQLPLVPPLARTVDRGFAICTVPITNRIFAAFVHETGYRTSVSLYRTGWHVDADAVWRQGVSCEWRRQPYPGSEADRPVTMVSWFDAMNFAAWLGRHAGVTARLPTSDEWRLAATHPALLDEPCAFPWGNGLPGIERRANFASAELSDHEWVYDDLSDGHAYASPVDAYPPSPRGLYDVVGNVWEWSFSTALGSDDPWSAAATNDAMALHGGCYLARLTHMTIPSRMSHPSLDGASDIGFRVVVTDFGS